MDLALDFSAATPLMVVVGGGTGLRAGVIDCQSHQLIVSPVRRIGSHAVVLEQDTMVLCVEVGDDGR